MSLTAPSPRHTPGRGLLTPMEVDVAMERLWPTADPYADDPSGWCRDRLGEHQWSKQVEIMAAVAQHRYVAVRSCHDTGKSYSAARLVAWWLDVHPLGSAFAVTTAPTTPQVEAILWREIGQAHRRANLDGRITLDARWYMGADEKELVAYGRKPADYIDPQQAAAAFQGIHARYVLVILDEACGIPRWLFDAADTLATNENARVLAIGNPDDPASHFAEVCRPGSGWHNIKIAAGDTPNFTDEWVPEDLSMKLIGPTWVEERKKRWGESSPMYISKVLGEFPDLADDTLISPRLVREAQDRELPGLGHGRLGCDIAREGDDQTAIYRNRDGVIRIHDVYGKRDTMETAGVILNAIKEYSRASPAVIDIVGVGAGVYDRLREQGEPVVPFGAGERAYNPRRFVNRRTEAYWNVRVLMEDGAIDLDPEDEELASQLQTIKYKLDSSGRIALETKKEMKKRGLPSPDRADAVIMSCVGVPSLSTPNVADRRRESDTITGDLLTKEM